MNQKELPFAFPIPLEETLRRRSEILIHLLAMDSGFCSIPVRSIAENTLQSMLEAYDISFLNGYLSKRKLRIDVSLSSRLTSSAGKFVCMRGAFGRINSMEIRLSSDYLLRLNQGPFYLNGLSVSTPQEAFLVVFEHELCHALETVLYGKTGHSSRFLSLAHGLFGHTATRHSLPSRRQDAAAKGLHVGSCVSFLYKGCELSGIVTYIGKTVTVMVPSTHGEYRDRRGKRYEKYHVNCSNIKTYL